MILELVTFKAPAGWSRDQVITDAKKTVPRWTGNRALLRKHFIRGIGDTAGTGGGVYVWPSIEAAKAAHDDAWRESVRARTGDYPKIQYFDLFLLVDNEKDAVIEFSEDGAAREPVG